jgi:multisubunit Na+/H+ antiporter MnhC subunit
MPITSALIVSAIVLAFLVFAVVLAWSEHQTRHWRQSAQSVPDNEAGKIKQTAPSSPRQRDLRPV